MLCTSASFWRSSVSPSSDLREANMETPCSELVIISGINWLGERCPIVLARIWLAIVIEKFKTRFDKTPPIRSPGLSFFCQIWCQLSDFSSAEVALSSVLCTLQSAVCLAVSVSLFILIFWKYRITELSPFSKVTLRKYLFNVILILHFWILRIFFVLKKSSHLNFESTFLVRDCYDGQRQPWNFWNNFLLFMWSALQLGQQSDLQTVHRRSMGAEIYKSLKQVGTRSKDGKMVRYLLHRNLYITFDWLKQTTKVLAFWEGQLFVICWRIILFWVSQ